jgi:hypothetical protein
MIHALNGRIGSFVSAIFLYKLYQYGYHKPEAHGNSSSKYFISTRHMTHTDRDHCSRRHHPCHLHHRAWKFRGPVRTALVAGPSELDDTHFITLLDLPLMSR